ncbi:uncharacterized protein K444DRAFT_424109 [Hyaloscypha bicolor E]|uniref:Uncharacterized protein n=1 Tax=Hyaloscypha bicolor E TaxID=1095630 RepID=A0A2J6T7W0_9HELO|nr:uncharacterized protein K444DRAFT_424109 [Hyaloscypha bicolor E]PMD59105.1 hypothetical protein K444DRAFT_424109 [Hyaloscypha bicolor E]
MCDCDGDLCPASNDEEKRLPETRLGVCFSWTYGTLRNLSQLPSQSPRHFFRFYWAPTPQLGQRVIHAFVHTRELDKYHGYLPATPYPIQRLDSESPSGSLDKYCNVLDWTGLYQADHTAKSRPVPCLAMTVIAKRHPRPMMAAPTRACRPPGMPCMHLGMQSLRCGTWMDKCFLRQSFLCLFSSWLVARGF